MPTKHIYIYPILKQTKHRCKPYQIPDIKMVESGDCSEFAIQNEDGYYYGMESKQGYLFIEDTIEETL